MSQTTEKSKHQEQYKTKIDALSAYQTDEEKRLKQQNSAAREAASISHQKLMKYLPQQTAGYSVGMTETAKIAANNSLQRQLAEADAAYEGSMADLKHYVAAEKDAAADKLYERERAEEQWQYQKDQDAAAKQEAIYNEMMTMMRNGEYGTTAELEKYLFGAAGNTSFDGDDIGYTLTPEQQRNLLLEYNTIKNDPASAERDEALRPKTDKDKLYVSTGFGIYDGDENDLGEVDDWITITDENDNNIWVDTTGKVSDEFAQRIVKAYKDQKKNENASIKDGAVLYFDGEYYIYKDGSIYGVKNEDGLGKILDNERRGVPLYQGVD